MYRSGVGGGGVGGGDGGGCGGGAGVVVGPVVVRPVVVGCGGGGGGVVAVVGPMDAAKPVESEDLTGHEELFCDDARPRPKQITEVTRLTNLWMLCKPEIHLKREAAQSAYEVSKEKDRTIMRLEEMHFLAISMKDLSEDNAYWINGTYMQMIRDNQFDGRIRSDPHRHIDNFLEISSLFQYGGNQEEAVMLRTFPFLLSGESKTWLNELNEGTITSWNEIREAFISQYFYPEKFKQLLNDIHSFH
nr:reverse transcriptase domain-containing protein [Tanacetum cinerariifolium]